MAMITVISNNDVTIIEKSMILGKKYVNDICNII